MFVYILECKIYVLRSQLELGEISFSASSYYAAHPPELVVLNTAGVFANYHQNTNEFVEVH